MRNIFLFIPFLLLSFSASAQEQDPCYSINDFITQLDIKPPISYQLSVGWNMVGYTGTAENSGLVNQINGALSNDSSVENTFQVIKNVSGQFWSAAFAQITSFTQGEGYMMYVISETAPSLSFNSAVNIPEIIGCTDCTAENFNAWATSDDESCLILGCTSDWADNYNAMATVDDENCYRLGCISEGADNYDALVTIDNGSCLFPIGCTEQWADNYNSYAVTDDGSCVRVGCDDQTADNYDAIATIINNYNCVYSISVDDFSAQMPTTDNNMSIVFSVGTLSDFVGGELMAFIDGQPVSSASSWSIIPEDGSSGVAVIGTCCSYGLASPGDQVDFAVLMNDEIIILIDVNPPVTYSVNGLQFIDNTLTTFTIDGNPVEFGCTDITYTEYSATANIDDGSCLTLPQAIAIGDLTEGGIVFYIDETGEHGLVAALEDITEGSNMGSWGTSEGYEWGCYQQTVSGADGTGIGTGYQNTLDIVAQNCQTQNGGITAAQATLNYSVEGFTDWYLPSKEELQEMYSTIGNGSSQGNIGGFETSDYPYYWSSSESSSSDAWVVYFSSGDADGSDKDDSLRVRCIRAF